MHNLEKFHQKNRKLQYRGEMKKKVVGCLNQSKSNWRGQGRSVTPDERKEDTNIRLKHDRGWERNVSREERRIWISGKVCSSKLRNVARRSRAPEGYERIRRAEGGIEPLNCEAFRLRFYLLSDDAQSSVDARKTNFRQWCNAVWISPSFPSTRSIKKWIVLVNEFLKKQRYNVHSILLTYWT